MKMNDKCNRKCHWKYNGECCAEDATHITDGTQYTANCSMFLEENFLNRYDKIVAKCRRMLNHMDYADLRKAKYILTNMEDFLKAKKLQKPVSPEWVGRMQFSENDYMNDYRCSICGLGVAEDYTHCPHCGQKINWQNVKFKDVKTKDIILPGGDVLGETLRKILDAERQRLKNE